MRHSNPHQQHFTRNNNYVQNHNRGVSHLQKNQQYTNDNDSGGGIFVVIASVLAFLVL